MRRDKSLHEISASARIAALLEKQGRGREGVFFKWARGGLISKAGGKNAIGRLDRHAVEGSLEWRTRGFFCGQLLSFNTTRQIIPARCVELWKSGREGGRRHVTQVVYPPG